jgi:hypothetical protein
MVSEKMVVVLRKVKTEKSAGWLGENYRKLGVLPKSVGESPKSGASCQLPLITEY